MFKNIFCLYVIFFVLEMQLGYPPLAPYTFHYFLRSKDGNSVDLCTQTIMERSILKFKCIS
jgi:hypothetical protein